MTWAIILGMWIHATLNAMVSYRPWRAPWEWVGELKLMWVVWVTCALWVALWWTLGSPGELSPITMPERPWQVPWWEVYA